MVALERKLIVDQTMPLGFQGKLSAEERNQLKGEYRGGYDGLLEKWLFPRGCWDSPSSR